MSALEARGPKDAERPLEWRAPLKQHNSVTRTKVLSVLIAIAATAINGAAVDAESYVSPDGFVPNAATAIAIAEAILIPIYGRAQIEAERPFSATLKDGVGPLKAICRPV
jgi:hypothetical protein